jgi:hypothetical protein
MEKKTNCPPTPTPAPNRKMTSSCLFLFRKKFEQNVMDASNREVRIQKNYSNIYQAQSHPLSKGSKTHINVLGKYLQILHANLDV